MTDVDPQVVAPHQSCGKIVDRLTKRQQIKEDDRKRSRPHPRRGGDQAA
ncbi:hypothetical protein [Mesorhizobium sp.]|nr:hypothetical protein [Mesorhizobium sp.]